MVKPSAFAAYSIPLWPMDMPPQATTGHACQGVATGAVVTTRLISGTIQLTSPTSVDPPGGSGAVGSNGVMEASNPFSSIPVDFCNSLANAISSSVYSIAPSISRLDCNTAAPRRFGISS